MVQKKNYWKILEKIVVYNTYSIETEDFERTYKISEKVKKLVGSEIELDGYITKYDFELGTNPILRRWEKTYYNRIESIDHSINIELNLKDKKTPLSSNQLLVKGILKINTDNKNRITYILENAVCLNCTL